MSTAEATELTDVMNRVKTWPTTLRITLAKSSNQLIKPKRKRKRSATGIAPPEDTRVPGGGSPRPLKPDRRSTNDETVKLSETTETHSVSPPPRKGSLKDLMGILKTDVPSPNDEECRAILEEEITKKHLK